MTTVLTNTGWTGDLNGSWTEGADLVNDTTGGILIGLGTVVNTRAGDDSISAVSEEDGGILNAGSIETGEGNDSISTSGGGSGILNAGSIETGEGNDSISASEEGGITNIGSIGTGEGKDSISASGEDIGIFNVGSIETGEGKDSVLGSGSLTGIFNVGTISTGAGNDTLIANGGFDGGGSVFLGTGSDYLKGVGGGSFNGGTGSDTLELTSGTYRVGINGATVSFTGSDSRGNGVAMNTTGFEKLIAGSTTYAFSCLSNGQSIIIA